MQVIEGRFTVQASPTTTTTTTTTSQATNIQKCSMLFLVMSSLVSYLC